MKTRRFADRASLTVIGGRHHYPHCKEISQSDSKPTRSFFHRRKYIFQIYLTPIGSAYIRGSGALSPKGFKSARVTTRTCKHPRETTCSSDHSHLQTSTINNVLE